MENNRDLENTILFYERVLAHVNKDNPDVNVVKEWTVGSFKEVLDRVISDGDGANKVNGSDVNRFGQVITNDADVDYGKEKA